MTDAEQGESAAPAARPRRPRAARPPALREPAAVAPVATVAVDRSLTHLDRLFDYLVPAELDAAARPGVRVRVRFAGTLVDGFLVERLDRSEHGGRLGFLEKVVSAEAVLAPEIATLARTVADRYVGSLADVLRLAVPPRHARVEAAALPAAEVPSGGAAGAPETLAAAREGWSAYRAGPAFLVALEQGVPARAVWQQAPGEDWSRRLAEAAGVAHAAGRGALLLVPDKRDLARLEAALQAELGADQVVALSADLGPAERYRRFLAVRRGRVRVVAGTRAAAFAPVVRPGLLVIVDDGDPLHAEPRAPYPHAREVLMLRSVQQGAALLVAGGARTAEAQLLVESGWARDVVADRATVRRRAPRIEARGDSYAVGSSSAAARARLAPAAFAAAREALAAGAPVLVQVPRRGYLPTLTCADCRRPARCRRCHGPLALAQGSRIPACRWCGAPEAAFVCGACGGTELRAATQGARRTAEELGRAFPGVPLVVSAGDAVRDAVPAEPAIVVATPGAEPVAAGGYGAALLLDGNLLLARPELRAAEEALRRWLAAATLVRPAADGGRVVLGVEGSLPVAQALIRWDPVRHAESELAGRRELGFPPVSSMLSLTADEAALRIATEVLELPPDAELLGPVPVEVTGPPRPDQPEQQRLLLRTAVAGRRALATAVRTAIAELSARRGATVPRVQVDPVELL